MFLARSSLRRRSHRHRGAPPAKVVFQVTVKAAVDIAAYFIFTQAADILFSNGQLFVYDRFQAAVRLPFRKRTANAGPEKFVAVPAVDGT